MRIAAVDLISNTCFPALAAEELGFYEAEGLDAHIELVPMLGATKALRNGAADAMIAGSVHDVLTAHFADIGSQDVAGLIELPGDQSRNQIPDGGLAREPLHQDEKQRFVAQHTQLLRHQSFAQRHSPKKIAALRHVTPTSPWAVAYVND